MRDRKTAFTSSLEKRAILRRDRTFTPYQSQPQRTVMIMKPTATRPTASRLSWYPLKRKPPSRPVRTKKSLAAVIAPVSATDQRK